MNIKLHNKYEITIRNKTYTAYNTLLNTVYNKIANLEQYTSHIAIGTGTSSKTISDTNLSNYLMTFKASTDEINCDVSQGTLFIRKSVVIDETFTGTFSFSELGITDSDAFDPIIYNHVLLKDQDGKIVSITRNQDDVMEIKVTIYLELTPESKALFVQGKNELIKQILGEELSLEDNNLYALRGENLIPNEYTNRTTPSLENASVCDKTISENSDGSINILYSAELGEGDTEEILLVFNNQVVLRLNTLEYNPVKEIETTFTTSSGNFIEVDKNVKTINSVATSELTADTSHTVVNFGKKLTDKAINLFDQSFNSSTPRFVSKDGKMIAFILNSYVHLYTYDSYKFNKINTTQVTSSNIKKIILFDDIMIIALNTDPYLEIYKIEDGKATQQTVNLTVFNNSVYSYDWIDIDATSTLSGKIKIGLIINDDVFSPVVLTLSKNSLGAYNDELTRPTLITAKKVFTIDKNAYCEPRICFLTDTYDGETYYFLEEALENSTTFNTSSDTAYSLLNNTTELLISGRTVLAQKNSTPYLIAYYYPNYEYTDSTFSTGIKHYCSKDGNYIIAKYTDSTYKIFNLHEIKTLTEFPEGFPSFVDFSSIEDFEFVGDYLLVFTSNTSEPLYGIAIKNAYTRLDNLSDPNTSYVVNYSKYDLPGSKTLEGVKINFSMKFGINEE